MLQPVFGAPSAAETVQREMERSHTKLLEDHVELREMLRRLAGLHAVREQSAGARCTTAARKRRPSVLVSRMAWKPASLGQANAHQPEQGPGIPPVQPAVRRQWKLTKVSSASSCHRASQLATATASTSREGQGS